MRHARTVTRSTRFPNPLLRAALVATLTTMPTVAAAQQAMAAEQEFGVDLSAFYSRQSEFGSPFSGSSASTSNVIIGTPVDVRIGLVSKGPTMFEPRFSFVFASSNGESAPYAFNPDVNVVFGLGKAKAQNDNKYFTVGVGANFQNNGGSSSHGFGQLQVNGGVGMRSPYGSSATRLEAFVQYLSSNKSNYNPSTLNIGARIGLSFWR